MLSVSEGNVPDVSRFSGPDGATEDGTISWHEPAPAEWLPGKNGHGRPMPP